MAISLDSIADFLSGREDSYIEIEKEIERAMVRGVLAPAKKLLISKIKTDTKQAMITSGNQTKQSLDQIGQELDSSMKGAFSKKVIETLEKESKNYTKLI